MPVDIANTEFHYFILHKNILTIMSKITETVISYYEVNTILKWVKKCRLIKLEIVLGSV